MEDNPEALLGNITLSQLNLLQPIPLRPYLAFFTALCKVCDKDRIVKPWGFAIQLYSLVDNPPLEIARDTI